MGSKRGAERQGEIDLSMRAEKKADSTSLFRDVENEMMSAGSDGAARVTIRPWTNSRTTSSSSGRRSRTPPCGELREQRGVEEHHLIPAPESGPTHHLYPVWENSLLKPICSSLPTASSKTLMRQEHARRRARKPGNCFSCAHIQNFLLSL